MEDEEPNTVDGETSEAEDLLLSDIEDTPSLDKGITLSIDYNARVVAKEVKCDNDGDDCDMRFVENNHFLDRQSSDAGLLTSTEDLSVSDDEDKLFNTLTLQSVNLASTSAKRTSISLSTLNCSHTVLKDESSADAENVSDDEGSSSLNEILVGKNKQKIFPPRLSVAGLSSAASAILPTKKSFNTFNIKNTFANSLLLDEDPDDLYDDPLHDEQESLPMTCLEFLKAEVSDGNNTDTEDISVGSLDDIGESRKDRNPFQRSLNTLIIPVSLPTLSSENGIPDNDKISYPGDSRRSSTAEFNTEDEIFSVEDFKDRSQKRVKKRNFIIVDKREVSDNSGTDEEIL